jgi:outer membrane lipoprotein-sorting protein
MNVGADPTPGSPGDDERLARAVAALRRLPMADGPSAETLDRTLAALQAAASSPKTTLIPGRKVMFTILKMAAALVVAAGGLFYLGGPHLAGAPVTFEEVAQKLGNAHTFAYLMTMELPNAKTPVKVRLLFKEPGLLRSEAVPASGPVLILDQPAHKRLMLNPAAKSAVLLEGKLPGEPEGAGQDLAVSEAENLRKLAQKKGEPAGEKQIGKVRAQGFRVKEPQGYVVQLELRHPDAQVQGFRVKEPPGYEQVIWVDPQTRLPVQIEISGTFGGGQTFHNTISDFQLDPKLDDSLFSLQPPQGYALQKVDLTGGDDKDDGTPETAVAKILRMYAEKSGGHFPKRIDDWVDIGEKFKDEKPQGPSDSKAKMMRLINLVVRVQILLLHSKGEYGYKPEGVKLGDAGKVLFWYKPKGKETYRAIFGDLHIADLAADQVPATEKPKPRP